MLASTRVDYIALPAKIVGMSKDNLVDSMAFLSSIVLLYLIILKYKYGSGASWPLVSRPSPEDGSGRWDRWCLNNSVSGHMTEVQRHNEDIIV
jgi:hypothetical protein